MAAQVSGGGGGPIVYDRLPRELEMGASTMSYTSRQMPSPVGLLMLVASDRGLAAVLWPDDDPKRVRLTFAAECTPHPLLAETERQLRGYFAGEGGSLTTCGEPR